MAVDKGARTTFGIIALLLAAVAVVLANLLSEQAFRRWDLTAEGRYSLSEPFLKVLDRLEDTVKLTYYTSGPQGTWFEQLQRDVLDRLGEIKTAGRGKVELEIVDPLQDKDARKYLRDAGVEFTVPIQEKDKLSVSTVFSSLRVTYLAKPSILIPVVQSAQEIEYELAQRIVELTLKDKPIVAISAPKPDQQFAMMMRRPPSSGFEWILGQEPESKRFERRDIELTAESSIPENTALLILVRPNNLGERARYEVARYLAQGGNLLLLAAPFKVVREFGWRVERTPSGLEDYLKDLGIEWRQDFLCDMSSARLTTVDLMGGQVQQLLLPFYVQILQQNVEQSYFATRLLPNLIMPFPAALAIDQQKAPSLGLKLEVLAKTSAESWFEPYSDTFDPRSVLERRNPRMEGSQPVFVQFEGQFPFGWEGKPEPEWDKKGEEDKKDEKKEGEKKDEKKEAGPAIRKKPGRLLVWSCPDSFNSAYMQDRETQNLFQGNASALINIAEAFSLGPELTQLRQKRYETRAIQRLSGEGQEALRESLKAALIFAIPAVVLVFALSRWLTRRARQVRYERRYALTTGPSSFTP